MVAPVTSGEEGGAGDGIIVVAGAGGSLGGRVAHRLLNGGRRIRVVGRRPGALEEFREAGAQVVTGDLRDSAVAAAACEGAAQLVSTANNVMGSGATSPRKVDRALYGALARAAREGGIRRWVHVSALGLAPDNPVDYFRIKYEVDGVVRESGVPWVLVQPSAFMDTWIDRILGAELREKGSVTLFGRGDVPTNFVAEDDVADVIVAVLGDPSVTGEAVPVGGPSTLTAREVVDRMEVAWGVTARRKTLPVPLMAVLRHVVGAFNEKGGRLISLGYLSATTPMPCPEWEDTARRFGVTPRTVEDFLVQGEAVRRRGAPPS